MTKIECGWGEVYRQAGSGALCVSPHELGEVGRYIFPNDFKPLEKPGEWALRTDENKKIIVK